MLSLSNTNGSVGDSETSGQAGNIAAPYAGKTLYHDLISRANAVPIINVFKHYGLRIDEHNPKIICPFKSHKGGRETTPSFKWYADTNSYYCFGCHVGCRAVDFVVEMDKCNKEKAATKILELFNSEVDEDLMIEGQSSSERLQIMMQFSNCVLEFRQNNTDEHATKFIEHMCWVYDRMNLRHKQDNDALRDLAEELIKIIQTTYTPCLKLLF